MSLPGNRGRDLTLEPLDDREGTRRAHLGEAAFTVAIVTPLRERLIRLRIRRSGLRSRGLAKGQGS